MSKDFAVQKPTPAVTSFICSPFCLSSTVGTYSQKWSKMWTGSSILLLIHLWLIILLVLCRVDTWAEVQRCAYSNPPLGLDGAIKIICHLMLLHLISCASFRHKQCRGHTSIIPMSLLPCVSAFPWLLTLWFIKDFTAYIKNI